MKMFGVVRCTARFALAVTMALPAIPSLHAQSMKVRPDAAGAAAAPVSQPQYASITGANDTLQLSRLPVTYNGVIYYADLTLALQFGVSGDGGVTFNVTPTVVASPALTVNNFKAGTYIGPADVNGDKSIIVVAGPAPLGNGGTGWSLTTTSASSPLTYPSTAVWYDEPIANNPLAIRLQNAKITSNQLSYGEGDSGSTWAPNSLLGFSQVGNTLVISDFSNCCGDQSTPYDTITYTLVP